MLLPKDRYHMTFTRFSAPRLTRTAISRLGLLLVMFSGAAHAHVDTDSVGGFAAGFLHPLTGLDHFTAMVAVGLWGVILGGPPPGCCRSSPR
jgi:urease accessory protein|tara:strand:- start:1018 stop:1293 length:276 start_codon:yes stop_codon:yes gene_type:complete